MKFCKLDDRLWVDPLDVVAVENQRLDSGSSCVNVCVRISDSDAHWFTLRDVEGGADAVVTKLHASMWETHQFWTRYAQNDPEREPYRTDLPPQKEEHPNAV